MNRLAQILEIGKTDKMFVVVCYECRDVVSDPVLSFEHAETRLFRHMSSIHSKKLTLRTDPNGKNQIYGVDS